MKRTQALLIIALIVLVSLSEAKQGKVKFAIPKPYALIYKLVGKYSLDVTKLAWRFTSPIWCGMTYAVSEIQYQADQANGGTTTSALDFYPTNMANLIGYVNSFFGSSLTY